MTSLNHLGADQAHAIRANAARLAEIDNLRTTSSLREVLLDLSYALADLTGPIGALADQWAAEQDDAPADLPDLDVLTDLAGRLRHMADNA